MARERVVYINGDIVPESQAKIPIRDQGFVYGDAVFDTTRTFGGKIFKLKNTWTGFICPSSTCGSTPDSPRSGWQS